MNVLHIVSALFVAALPSAPALVLNLQAARGNPISFLGDKLADLFRRPAIASPTLGAYSQWQSWSELIVLRDHKPKPFVFCAMPKNGCTLWKQAMLRAAGNQHWNTTQSFKIHNPLKSGLDLIGVVRGGNPADYDLHQELPQELQNFTDITSIFGPTSPPSQKAAIVRDPITRMLSAYLDRCHDLGEWFRCLSDGPAEFGDVVLNYEGVAVDDMDLHFRPQVDMCGLRYVEYDMIGKMESFEEDSRRIMEWAGLWEDYGRTGWGPQGLSAFAEAVQLQSNHLQTHDTVSQVCSFYTPELLQRVHGIYEEDFTKFGYDVKVWERLCEPTWGKEHVLAQPIALHTQMPSREARLLHKEKAQLFGRTKEKVSGKHWRPPCVPPTDAVPALKDSISKESRSLRYYLYEHDEFDFNDTVKCLLKAWDVSSSDFDSLGGVDQFAPPNISEHLGELWLFRQLRNHKQRTHNASEADVRFVAAPAFTSFVASRWGCGTAKDHEDRMAGVLKRLMNTRHFADGGKDWVFFATTPMVNKALTPDLVWALQERGSIVATADFMYPDWHAYDNIRKIILPYKAHSTLDKSAMMPTKSATMADRNISFLFHGNLNRTFEGKHRSVILPLSKMLPDADVKSVQFWRFKDFRHQAMTTAQKVAKSQFCIVPAGDTPSSRRLYDALAAGCVPVVFADFGNFSDGLPFKSTVDWSSIAIYGGELGCVANNTIQEAAWLNYLRRLGPHDSMREAGRTAFREHFSYLNGGGLLNTFLRELSVQFF